MAGTVAWDPFWQGGMGLPIGYRAKTGEFDPTKEPKEHREFYGTGVIITARQCAGLSTTPTSSRSRSSGLERHLGPRQRSDPVQLAGPRGAQFPGCAPLPPFGLIAASRQQSSAPWSIRSASGKGPDPEQLDHRPLADRRRKAETAALAHCILGAGHRAAAALRDHQRHQSELPQLRQLRADQPVGDDPAGARHWRDLHHSHGIDRSLGRRRADPCGRDPLDARAERSQCQRLWIVRRGGRPDCRRRGRLRQRAHPRATEGAVVHDDARHLVHRRRNRQCHARRHGHPDQRSVDSRPRDRAIPAASPGASGWRCSAW